MNSGNVAPATARNAKSNSPGALKPSPAYCITASVTRTVAVCPRYAPYAGVGSCTSMPDGQGPLNDADERLPDRECNGTDTPTAVAPTLGRPSSRQPTEPGPPPAPGRVVPAEARSTPRAVPGVGHEPRSSAVPDWHADSRSSAGSRSVHERRGTEEGPSESSARSVPRQRGASSGCQPPTAGVPLSTVLSPDSQLRARSVCRASDGGRSPPIRVSARPCPGRPAARRREPSLTAPRHDYPRRSSRMSTCRCLPSSGS